MPKNSWKKAVRSQLPTSSGVTSLPFKACCKSWMASQCKENRRIFQREHVLHLACLDSFTSEILQKTHDRTNQKQLWAIMCTCCIFRKLPEPHCQEFHGPCRAYLLCFLHVFPRCSHRLLLALLTSKSNRLKATSSAAQNMLKWFDFLASVKWFLIFVACALSGGS